MHVRDQPRRRRPDRPRRHPRRPLPRDPRRRRGAPADPADPAAHRPAHVSFVPIDDNSLRVTLLCPGADGIEAQLRGHADADRRSTPGSSRASRRRRATTRSTSIPSISRRRDLFGACRLEVSTTGYVTKTFAVTIEPIRGRHNVVHRNVALVRPRDVAGHAYWIDDGPTPATPRVATPAASRVRLQTRRRSPASIPAPCRTTATAAVRRRRSASRWRRRPPTPMAAGRSRSRCPTRRRRRRSTVLLPRQVFGQATYAFELAGRFTPRWIQMTIDETSRTAVGVLPTRRRPAGSPTPGTRSSSTRSAATSRGASTSAPSAGRRASTLGADDLAGFTAALSGANAVTGVDPACQRAANVGSVQVCSDRVRSGSRPTPAPTSGRRRSADAARRDPAPLRAGHGRRRRPVDRVLPASRHPAVARRTVPAAGEDVRRDGQPQRPGRHAGWGHHRRGRTSDVGGADDRTGDDGRRRRQRRSPRSPCPPAPSGSTGYQIALAAAVQPAPRRADGDRAGLQRRRPAGPPHGCLRRRCNVVNIPQGGQPRVRITVPRYGTLTATVCGYDVATTARADLRTRALE